MNSWKLNSTAGHWFRLAVSKTLNIHFTEVYRAVKFIQNVLVAQLDRATLF